MAGAVSALHAVVSAFVFLLACVAASPVAAQVDVGGLRLQYERACAFSRSLDLYRDQVRRKMEREQASFSDVLRKTFETDGALADLDWSYRAYASARIDFEAAEIAALDARTACLRHRSEYVNALTEQIVMAALTEPPKQETRPTRRTPGTNRRRPPVYQERMDTTAAASAIIEILGGALTRPPSRPTRWPTRGGGRRYY